MLIFNKRTPEKIRFNGKHVAEVILNGVRVWIEKILTMTIGYPITLTNSTGEDIVSYKIYGNSIQDGTPTPDAPVEVESVGEYDEATKKYKIPIKVNDNVTNIYLDEPLRKIGNYADYIDFENKKVIRKITKLALKGTEDIFLFSSNPHPYDYYVIGERGQVVDDVCLSTHFQLQTNFSYQREGSNKFRVLNSSSANQSRIVFRLVLNEVVTDLAKVKAYLEAEYNNGTPVIFYYAVANGLEAEETIELLTIPTQEGTNVIEVDTSISPSNMEVEYMRKGVG